MFAPCGDDVAGDSADFSTLLICIILTFSSCRQVSYYPDHDIALKFDVCVDNDDLRLINNIRYQINDALSRDLRAVTLPALKYANC